MLAKHALSQLSYGPFVVCAPSGARTLASARRRLRGWQSLAALHANARQSKRRESAAVIRLPTADSRLPIMVGLGGLEPPTSRLSSARSNQLSYKPAIAVKLCLFSEKGYDDGEPVDFVQSCYRWLTKPAEYQLLVRL